MALMINISSFIAITNVINTKVLPLRGLDQHSIPSLQKINLGKPPQEEERRT
jgi:hypothetical protein